VDNGALDDALERGGWARILAVLDDKAVQFLIDEVFKIALERVDIDIAAIEHGDRFAVVGQGQQEVLKRCELMVPLARQVHRLMQSLFESARE